MFYNEIKNKEISEKGVKYMKKTVKYLIALMLVICCILNEIPCIMTNAATETVTGVETGYAYKSDRYIYYSFGMFGTGIVQLDTKTKKKKTVVSSKYKGSETNGIYNLTVKGNYIYGTWDLALGTEGSQEYIYRFSKNGKTKKRLACGINPVIINDRIYYEKCTLKEYGDITATESTGKIYSMKLDGTDKKYFGKTDQLKLHARARGHYIRYDYTDTTSPLTVGNYQYYVAKDGKTLYRYNKKTKKTNKVITCPDRVDSFMVQGNYVIVIGYSDIEKQYDDYCEQGEYITYCVSADGKTKIKLQSWAAAA